MNYKSEKDFLKNYNSDNYEKLSMTTDVLIFSISTGEKENYRRLSEKHFSVLLVKRDDYPFKDKWCLPGGFIGIDEDLDEAPKRILKNETKLKDIYLEQLYTFGDVNRDPRMRIVSTSYMALIDRAKLKLELSDNVSWFNISYSETKSNMVIKLENGKEELEVNFKKIVCDPTTERYKYIIDGTNQLAFDHSLVIATGISRLKNKLEYTDIVFNMMPEYFTLGELQQVYELILGKKLLDPAFRRIISNKVKKTDKLKTGGGHRPSVLYKYNQPKRSY